MIPMTEPVREDFTRRADEFRPELLAHCYRMLGSIHDAEDLVQETYLRAWRSYDAFEGRASIRTWLYKIATNACLNALERSDRRVLPAGLGGPTEDPDTPIGKGLDLPWLQPFPDRMLASSDPAAVAMERDGIRLAFVAALQHLPARQRAVLILRDVLAWRAAEVADLLGTSTAAVNSALQRAHAQIAAVTPTEDTVGDLTDEAAKHFLERYMTAFANADIDGLTAILRDDVELEMPPNLTWFRGRTAVARFLEAKALSIGSLRFVPTAANGQLACVTYSLEPSGDFHAHNVHVFDMTKAGISRITVFIDPALAADFGLPLTLPAD